MKSAIPTFLSLHRIAIVGVSTNPSHFSRAVYRAWRDRSYDVVPVHPNAPPFENTRCAARPQDIDPPVEAAIVMTPPAASEQAVKDCAAAGIRSIWLYRRAPAAESFCADNGISLIAGECPLMYLPKMGLIHRIHRWLHS